MDKCTCWAKKAYPDESFYDYDIIVDSIGETLVCVSDSDYQGDSRYLLQKGDKVAYLSFGWGSCSGCDALQGCSNYEELEELRQNLSNVQWLTKDEMIDFLKNHDWEGDYHSDSENTKEFVKKALSWMENNFIPKIISYTIVLDKEICKKCRKKLGWHTEDEKYWKEGLFVCPHDKTHTLTRNNNIPEDCIFRLEQTVSDKGSSDVKQSNL